MLEQKIIEAKANRRKQFIITTIGLVTVLLLCAVILFISNDHINGNSISVNEIAAPEQNIVAVNSTIPDKQLRQAYIDTQGDYENNLKPELNKIDLSRWNQDQSNRLDILEDEALSKFSAADYAGAEKSINALKQLAQTVISDTQKAFKQALSNAQSAYKADQYEEAKFQVANALMLNNTSVEAEVLSTKISKLPEILTLLEKINTAKVENNPEKELNLLKELIKLDPEREVAVERKQVLIGNINTKKFNSYIAQSYQAIKQGNSKKAKLKISAAKHIFPNRQEIKEVVTALQQLEKKQHLKSNQQKIQSAIASDDWIAAKKQLEFALREHAEDKSIQKSLLTATTIIALNNEFKQQINNPYRLSNKQLALKMKGKIAQASTLGNLSPSLKNKTNKLSRIIESINKKITVEISSDNQTHILVRGIGVVGITQQKTIQLTPGRYTFEGKRKGYKSKLVNVLIPYDQTNYHISIRCDEPI